MTKIRADLDGHVYVYVDDQPVRLGAGDEVPEGTEVGDHVIEVEPEKKQRTARSK